MPTSLESVLRIVSFYGDVKFWVFAFSSTFFLSLILKERLNLKKFSLLGLIILLFSYFLVGVLKVLFDVPRPCVGMEGCPSTPSFPSGHATVAFVSSTWIFLNFRNLPAGLLLFSLSSLVSASRVYFEFHTLQDVFAGALLGTSLSAMLFAISRWRKSKEIWWFYKRKLAHLACAFGASILLYFYGRPAFAYFTLLLSASYAISETFRLRGLEIPFLTRFSLSCMSEEEKKSFVVEPLSLSLGILLVGMLFPLKVALISFVAVGIGDVAAAVFGRVFGRIRWLRRAWRDEKTLEGCLASFFSLFASYSLFFPVQASLLLSSSATIVELVSPRKVENFAIALSTALVASFLNI